MAEERRTTSLDPNLGHVIDMAKEELRHLIEQRAQITRRMTVIKQTIAGLVSVFGDTALDQVRLEFVEDRGGSAKRRSVFTRTLRMLLINEKGPVTARTMSEELTSKHPELASRHKDLVASVTTNLNRLVSYGEACSIELDGKRAWQWEGKDYATSSRSIDDSPTES